MMVEPRLFDISEAVARRENAVMRVTRNTDHIWFITASRAVVELVETMDTFTTDEVWGLLATHPYNLVDPPHEPKAMAAVMRRARGSSLIEPLDEWRLSRRPACHIVRCESGGHVAFLRRKHGTYE